MDSEHSHFDVLVCGGGPSGIGGAVGAARAGAKVGLIERHPVLGGMGTAALVNNFCPAHLDGERIIIGGVFGDLRQRLIDRNALFVTGNLEPYDPAAFDAEAKRMCEEGGVRLMLGSGIDAADFSNDMSATIRLTSGKSVSARAVVDATGDGLLAKSAGVPFRFGRESDGCIMPLTMCYICGPVDIDEVAQALPNCIIDDQCSGRKIVAISADPKVNEWVREARRKGELTIERDHVSMIISVPRQPENVCVNFGRVFVRDSMDPAELRRAEAAGREQVENGIAFFRKYIPGFKNTRLIELPRQIGVRESRHIEGLYTLAEEDLLAFRQFDDVIAQCCYAIDIHEPGSDSTRLIFFPPGKHYDIPWRCLVPASGAPNIVFGGRSISATHSAASSFRVSPSVMAIGEAAGVTAALAAKHNRTMRDVPSKEVQELLVKNGGILS